MLRIQVELVPHGDESRASTLTMLYVGNDGTGTSEKGNYNVYTEDPRGKPFPREERSGWIGRIEGFSRYGRNRNRDALAAEALMLAVRNG